MKNGWEVRALGEVCRIQNGYAFDSKRFSYITGLPLIRIRDLKGGLSTECRYDGDYDDKYLVHAGDFLVGMDGDFGCYEWHGPDALLNQRVCRLEGFTGALLPRFLFYGLNQHLREIQANTTFTTVKHLSSKQVLAIRFPVPPLAEQERIVRILDDALTRVDSASRISTQAHNGVRQVYEAHLNQVFSEGASRWSTCQLQDVCRRITVGHVGSMASKYEENGVPFLRSQNIRPFKVDLQNLVYIDDDFHRDLAKSRLQPGDLAIVRTGYPGTAAVIPDSLPVANCSDLVIVKPDEGVLADYLAMFLNSQHGRVMVGGRLVGAAQKHFNVKAARHAVIPIPSITEQKALVRLSDHLRMSVAEAAVTEQQKTEALDELRTSLLHHAFTSQL